MRLTGLVVGAAVVVSATAALGAAATGEKIKSSIAGNTIQGDMGGPYSEFYAEDGTVLAKDYKAKWSIEGDTMCWVYEGKPKDCWAVEIDGDAVNFMRDGTSQGTGTIVKGNPNNFQ